MLIRTKAWRFALAGFTAAAFAPAAAGAQELAANTGGSVSHDAVEATVPSGNAGPDKAVSSDQTRPRPTEALAVPSTATARPGGSEPSSAPIQTSQLSFEGTGQTQSLRPPDTHGAVGASHFVEVTNSTFEAFNKTSGAKTKSVTLNSFCGYTPTTMFDPRIVYDKAWNRWVLIAEAFPEASPSTNQILCIAASLTSDPNGGFFIYKINAPRLGNNANFYDYPMVGMDQDAILITANIFSSADAYLGSNLFGVAKADLYNGRGFSVPVHSTGANGTVAPPIVETKDAAAVLMATSHSSSAPAVKLFRATGMGRSNASLSAPVTVAVTSMTASGSAAQPGTSDRLDVLNRFVDHGTQISNHVVNVTTTGGTLPTPRWYQFNGASNAKVAEGAVFESSSSHDWNPSVAASGVGGTASNPIGRMFFTWSATAPTGTTHQARVKASGRLQADATTITGGANLSTSSTFYNASSDTTERWGDYSSVTLDPTAVSGCAAGNRAYVVNEKINSVSLWGSRFGRIGFC